MTARQLLVSTNRKNGFLRIAFESDDVFVTHNCQRLESLTGLQIVCLLAAFGGTKDSSESFVFSTWLRGSHRRRW